MAAPVLVHSASGGREYQPRDAAGAGADLRDARERRGLSIEQLSRTTKIAVRSLRSIETDQFDKLPASVFLRGFLRAYAKEVGLDPEETVRRYIIRFEPAAKTLEGHDSSEAPVHLKRPAERNDAIVAALRALPAAWVIIAMVLAATGYGITRWRAHGRDVDAHRADSPPISQSVSSHPPSTDAARPEIGTAGSRAIPATTTVPPRLRIAIRAQGTCWVSATADGTKVVYRLMEPGETETIEARQDAVLRIGDAGAFTFAINGASGRSLGRGGEAVSIRITRQNFGEFLANAGLGTTGR
jgi:cytoskeletal protein RodZ